MVAGHLHEKNGYYYIILNLTDSAGRRKPKWISTGLTIKGNKKRAEQMLMEERRKYANAKAGDDVLFADFMEQWLEIVKSTVSIPTYSSYVNAVKSIIAPYFRKKKILLRDLQAHDIQMFYQEQLQRVKASSVIHYHANIHKALKYAVKNDMIPSNPADKVERPKQDKFYGNFYDRDELNKLFEAVAGTKLELPVLLGAFYGLRRSEIVGLKWSAIDFEQNTITISHTVTSCNLDGKCVIVAKDTTKTKSSRRTLPLVPYFHEKLLAVKAQQERNQKLADCLSHFNDGQQITVLTKLVFHVFSEAGSFLFGQPRQFIPIGDTRIVMTRPFLIPAIRCAIDFRVKLPVNQIEDYIVGADCVPASFLARIFARD